jgi:hypothetical protein
MVFHCQKSIFKESSFCHLRQYLFAVNKHFDSGARRAAIELCRAKVSQRVIMKQLGMSKVTLKRVLAFSKANSSNST